MGGRGGSDGDGGNFSPLGNQKRGVGIVINCNSIRLN